MSALVNLQLLAVLCCAVLGAMLGSEGDQAQPCDLCWPGNSRCRKKNWSGVAASASNFQEQAGEIMKGVGTQAWGVRSL